MYQVFCNDQGVLVMAKAAREKKKEKKRKRDTIDGQGFSSSALWGPFFMLFLTRPLLFVFISPFCSAICLSPVEGAGLDASETTDETARRTRVSGEGAWRLHRNTIGERVCKMTQCVRSTTLGLGMKGITH